MKKLFLFLLTTCITFIYGVNAQTISGVVTGSDDGAPLPGVNILVKGTTNGTITDLDGGYIINVPGESSVLVFSSMGYQTQEVACSGKTKIDIVLEVEDNILGDVVIVGYGTMKKSDVTGSVGKVNVDDLKKVSTIDAAQALQGRLAGVNVMSNSGNPSSGTTIRIRGVGSINNSDPLFVVDGFPMGDISHIAPTDIESLEVLKDASATAIYGSRGANGVILVKTRSGAKGQKMQVQANVLTGISNVAKRLDLADAVEFSKARRDIGNTDATIDYILEQEAAGNYLKGTDWQDEIYRQGINTRYNVSVLGSTNNYDYDHGVTYSNQKGVIKGSYLDKLMFHSNNNVKLSEKIKLGMNFNYVWYERPNNSDNDYYTGILPGALRSDPISTAWDDYTDFYGEIYYSQAASNPAIAIWKMGSQKSSEHKVLGNFYLQFDDLFIEGLSFRTQFGSNLAFFKDKSYSAAYFITPTQKNDDATLQEKRENTFSWMNTNYFSYNKSFDKFNVNATLGMEIQSYKRTDIWAKAYGVPEAEQLQYIGAKTNSVLFDMGGGIGQNRLASGFARGNFSWDSKYALTATIRMDGTSKFKEEKRWGYFPSFAGSWNISNETFMESASFISNLKLRAGWGSVGNQASAGDFDYVSSVENGYTYALNGVSVDGSVQRKLANAELMWEAAEQLNTGIDFGFFDNKLTGTVDYFIRKTTKMMLDNPIPLYAGKAKPKVNAGTLENRGFEFSVNYAHVKNDFKFDIGLNLSFIQNEITSLASSDPIRSGGTGRSGNITKTEVGKEIAYFYGYKTSGIFQTQAMLDQHTFNGNPIQPNAQLGDVIYQDISGDGVIDEDDMTYLGSGTPDFTGGLNINVAYKNFDLTLFLYGSYGNEIVNAMYQTMYSSRMFECNISSDMANNHWSPENPTATLPRLTASDLNENDSKFSDRWVEDGSYIRLKNIQLGYTIPAPFAKKLKIKGLRVYTSIDNLLTFTKYSGLDPELFGLYSNPLYYGIDMVNYPQPRTYSFGLNLTF